MRTKFTKKLADEEARQFDIEEMEESMILGLSAEGNSIYVHTFDDDIKALEFLEVMVAGFRAEILNTLTKRSLN